MDEALKVTTFLDRLKVTRPRAAERYYYAFKSFANWLGKPLESLTVDDFMQLSVVEEYLDGIENPYTANTFVSACRSFARFVKFNYRPRSIEDRLYKEDFYEAMHTLSFEELPEYTKSEAITVDELRALLEVLEDEPLLYSATVLHFYTGARPSELARPYEVGKIDLDRPKPEPIVDFRKRIMSIPTAKSRKGRRMRIIPIDGIQDHVRVWIENVDEIANYAGGKGYEWYTKNIKAPARKAGVRVTAKTARKTFETEMTRRGIEEWERRYWLGHKWMVPDRYRDYTKLIDKLREDVVSRHYIFDVIGV